MSAQQLHRLFSVINPLNPTLASTLKAQRDDAQESKNTRDDSNGNENGTMYNMQGASRKAQIPSIPTHMLEHNLR